MSGKKKRNKIMRWLPAVIVCLMLLLSTGVSVGAEEPDITEGESVLTYDEIAHGRIVMWLGGAHEMLVKNVMPEASLIAAFTTVDMGMMVRQNKADAFVMSKPYVMYYADDLSDLVQVGDPIGTMDTVAIFPQTPKGEKLRSKFNEFIAVSRANGMLQELEETWLEKTPSVRQLDYSRLPKDGEVIRLTLSNDHPPFCMSYENKLTGFEMEFILRFCEEYGYKLDINVMSYDAILANIAAGKSDLGISGIEYYPERAESCLMSDSMATQDVIIMGMRADRKDASTGFWSSVKKSFERSFIKEDRYKMYIDGLISTIEITGVSLLLGTLLGFAIFSLYSRAGKIVKKVITLLENIIHLVPALIILMVFYYIIFGKIQMPGQLIAGATFSLIFGVAVFGNLRTSIDTLGVGQREAAYTLGYSNTRAFWTILFPQAIPFFIPRYKGDIVAMMMETSIVGYIAINDLTRSGYVVRSLTFEPFFPLLITAAGYALLAVLVMRAVDRIGRRIDPRQRSKDEILEECTK